MLTIGGNILLTQIWRHKKVFWLGWLILALWGCQRHASPTPPPTTFTPSAVAGTPAPDATQKTNLVPAATQTPATPLAAVPAERLARLRRGVNLPGWFWGFPSYNYTTTDLAELQRHGFTFVRLPIASNRLYTTPNPSALDLESLNALLTALSALRSQNLAVLLDLHQVSTRTPGLGNQYPELLLDPAYQQEYRQLWAQFATFLALTTDPDWVFLQPLNEPVFATAPEQWLTLQSQVLSSIRQRAPSHTLIATSANWQSIDTLMQLPSLPDGNLVYDFHFYEPFMFTHQGADWVSDEGIRSLHDVPYPFNAKALAKAQQSNPQPAAQAALQTYAAANWNRAKIDARIAQVATWAQARQVHLICSEFGAYGISSPPTARLQWLSDVRQVLEQYQIGWALWEYRQPFGFLAPATPPAPAQVDTALLQVLGLLP